MKKKQETKKTKKNLHSQGNGDTVKYTKVYMMAVPEEEKRGKKEKSKQWCLETYTCEENHPLAHIRQTHSKQDKWKEMDDQMHNSQNVERQGQILKASEKINISLTRNNGVLERKPAMVKVKSIHNPDVYQMITVSIVGTVTQQYNRTKYRHIVKYW